MSAPTRISDPALAETLARHLAWLRNEPGGFRANLYGADLSGANLSRADLSRANLSGAKGILDAAAWMSKNFEHDAEGWIVYKAIGNTYFAPPEYWKIGPSAFLEEVPNPDRCVDCGSGVNFATLEWIGDHISNPGAVWKCRIAWVDSCGIIVPYMADGKARCARLELLEIVNENQEKDQPF